MKFGPDGDFVTAPEISTLFGRSLAHGVAPTLAELGRDAVVFELGAGSGRLAVDLLTGLAALDRLPAEYLILEVSGDLRERQQAAIASLDDELARRVRWLNKLPEVPLRGVVVANEVLDALPFERFRVADDGRFESAWVTLAGDNFELVWDRPTPELATDLAALRASLADEYDLQLAPGYVSEICPAARAFVFALAERLAAGLLLLADYGGTRREMYLPERSGGTLLCHHRHRAHEDPFFLPGMQDITAWVDFSAVAGAGVDAGLDVAGYTTQAHFLLGCGLPARLAEQLPADATGQAVLHSEAKTLTLPGEMGERVKFLGLARDLDARPAAFALRDLAVRL